MADFNEKNTQRGFTLVELMVVITIFALLVTVSIGGYISYRKRALFALQTEDFVSVVTSLHDKSVYGEVDGLQFDEIQKAIAEGEDVLSEKDRKAGGALCTGLYLDEGNIYGFSSGYSGLKIFDEESGDFVMEGCKYNPLDVKKNLYDLNLENELNYLGAYYDEKNKLDGALILFVPPFGDVELRALPGDQLVDPQVIYFDFERADGVGNVNRALLDPNDAGMYIINVVR